MTTVDSFDFFFENDRVRKCEYSKNGVTVWDFGGVFENANFLRTDRDIGG